VVMFLESWYRFFPGVYIIIILCFSGGVVAGIVFVDCLEFIRCLFEGQTREFVLSMGYAPVDLAILTASLVGLLVEPFLRNHCIHIMDNPLYCFTRISGKQGHSK